MPKLLDKSHALSGKTHHTHLTGEGSVTPAGTFEILAITAGIGNAWEFSESCLRESLALWEGADCYVDHSWFSHSVRDLAGVCHSAVWDPVAKGIKMQLKPVGPSSALLVELGQQILADDQSVSPGVGFSADVSFTALGDQVQSILKVHSVDLVPNPARGGSFLRALNAVYPHVPLSKEALMPKQKALPGVVDTTPPPDDVVQMKSRELAGLDEDRQAVRLLLDEQSHLDTITQEAEQARQLRASMCEQLLDASLGNSKLPAPVIERVRKQFAGNVFEVAALQEAIDDAREMVSELTASATVQGPGRITGMFNSDDQVSAAIHDMLAVDRPDDIKSLKVNKLSGIRELYTLMTGDYDFVGGYNPDRVQLSLTTDLPGVLKNCMNKLIILQWEELGRAGYRWWEPIVSVEHFNSLQSLTGVLVGEITVLPEVAEGAEYTELAVSDSPETASWAKYGGYVGLTLEMFERDETHKLRQYPKKLASAALRRISGLVSAIFTANSGIGPTMADTGALFNATAVTTPGGHANLLTTALASAEWEVVGTAMYEQPMLIASGGTAPVLALDPKYLLVPRELRITAMRILYPSWERESNIHSENLQRGEMGDVITVPEWTDANNWAAVCDPRIAPAIIVGERFGIMPEIFVAESQNQGALFTNDEVRIKVRHWVSVFVADFRPLHKSNVA